MQMVLDIRAKAKADKDWATSDKIREDLNKAGIIIKDTPDGAIWEI
jgi:cysteinyl-tRNA synthetase